MNLLLTMHSVNFTNGFIRIFKIMKKLLLLLSLLTCSLIMDAETKVSIDDVWKEFRANHPYGFQTVGLKHNGDEQIFVISEPSENVSFQAIESLFSNYNGTVTIKKDSLGYDGWLADVVGSIKFKSTDQESEFKNKIHLTLDERIIKNIERDLGLK